MPLAIPGVVFFSLIMALYDGVALYPEKGASTAGMMTLLFALVLPFLLQLAFVAFLQKRLTRDPLFIEYRRRFKLSTFLLVVLSFAINLRFFKLIYTNVAERFNLRSLRDAEIRNGWRPRRFYMLLCMFMVPFDLALCIIALVLLSWPNADSRLVKVAVERILICLILVTITVTEYYKPRRNCCKREQSYVVPDKDGDSLVAPDYNSGKSANDYRALTSSVLTDIDQTNNRSFALHNLH
mmetsp:Transcript_39905/g.52225  ORF Transcript_39905/g.52225 Transcript_39905/m.52225 type:complete len:239 (+) Transcript_39905:460-1176(+)